LYRSNAVVMIYLACDAAYLGLLAALWTMVFFTERYVGPARPIV
jgi:hypothetical protein